LYGLRHLFAGQDDDANAERAGDGRQQVERQMRESVVEESEPGGYFRHVLEGETLTEVLAGRLLDFRAVEGCSVALKNKGDTHYKIVLSSAFYDEIQNMS